MLFRILSQNPGPSFTRNINEKFVSTVHALLRDSKDPSVQQIMRETLDSLEREHYNEPGPKQLVDMWRQMKGHGARITGPPIGQPQPPQHPGQDARVFQRHQLPSPQELASRVEESRNTAKILMQLVQSTPTDEVLGSDLIKEFAERCQSAQRSIQGYINCDSPPPDDDTLQTLIEVNEQLSLSLSRYQRAVLSARRAMGAVSAGTSPNPEQQAQRASSIPMSHASSQPQPPVARQAVFPPPVAADVSPIVPSNSMHLPPPPPPQKPMPRIPVAQPSEPVRPTRSAPPVANYQSPDPFADPAEQSHLYSQPPPQRPGTYFTNGATPSYVGRQNSAANGLTMHGADIEEEDEPVHEIDSNSRVDRSRDLNNVDIGKANGYTVNRGNVEDDDDDLYTNSPVRERSAYRY